MDFKDRETAKMLFEKYDGSFSLMGRDGVYEYYKSFAVPKNIEVQWMNEKRKSAKQALCNSCNKSDIVTAFRQYGHYSSLLKDSLAFEEMYQYITEYAHLWDSNTLCRCISILFITMDVEHKELGKYRPIIQECIHLLKRELHNGVTTSSDYEENGILPIYHTETFVQQAIEEKISYWEKKLKTS